MTWQDLVIGVVNAMFTVALIPTIVSPKARVPRRTSGPTALGCALTGFTTATLGLWFATGFILCAALGWGLIWLLRSGSQAPDESSSSVSRGTWLSAVDYERNLVAFQLRFSSIEGDPPKRPRLPTHAVRLLRARLIAEEAAEVVAALQKGDLKKIGQELVDLLYVTFGTAVVCGLRMAPFWREVHRANMEKLPAGPDGKVRKPEGWRPPDLDLAMREASQR